MIKKTALSFLSTVAVLTAFAQPTLLVNANSSPAEASPLAIRGFDNASNRQQNVPSDMTASASTYRGKSNDGTPAEVRSNAAERLHQPTASRGEGSFRGSDHDYYVPATARYPVAVGAHIQATTSTAYVANAVQVISGSYRYNFPANKQFAYYSSPRTRAASHSRHAGKAHIGRKGSSAASCSSNVWAWLPYLVIELGSLIADNYIWYDEAIT